MLVGISLFQILVMNFKNITHITEDIFFVHPFSLSITDYEIYYLIIIKLDLQFLFHFWPNIVFELNKLARAK